MGSNPSLVPEIGPDGLPREAPLISFTEQVLSLFSFFILQSLIISLLHSQIIEAEQLQLKKYIQENYSKIRDVERELANLGLEMKLTAGLKKAALEHMRKKIEASTEKIRVAKLKEEQARKVWESASKEVRDEEATKQKLCEDLSKLVEESNNSQLSRLEELKRRFEAMNPNRSSTTLNSDGRSASSALDNTIQDGSSVSNARETNGGLAENAAYQNNGQKDPVMNANKLQPPNEGERSKKKKKVNFQLKGKGIGAVSKSKSSASGWTGSGFDVDGRT